MDAVVLSAEITATGICLLDDMEFTCASYSN